MARLSKKEFAKKKQEEMRTTINEAMSNVASFKHNPEDIKEYLDFMAKMYDYSPRNQMLLQNQYEGASGVASKKHFEELGFKVNEHEKPMQVLAPVFKNLYQDENNKWKPQYKATKEEKEKIKNGDLKSSNKLSYYKLVDVYDIGQTNAKAEDYPKIFPNRPYAFDEREINEKYPNVKQSIKNYAEKQGFNVIDENNTNKLGSAKGAYYPFTDDIRMRPNLSNGEYISTLNHELAHGYLHKNSNQETHTKELEAEMTAYVTNKHFGLDTSEKSIDYIANWTQNLIKVEDKELINSVERVSKASREIISGIEKEYEQQYEFLNEARNDFKNDVKNNTIKTKEDLKTYDPAYQKNYESFFTKFSEIVDVPRMEEINARYNKPEFKEEVFNDFKNDVMNNTIKTSDNLKQHDPNYQKEYTKLTSDFKNRANEKSKEQEKSNQPKKERKEKEIER